MERIIKAIATIVLTVAVLFAAGCVKEDNGPEQGGNDEVSVNPEYVPIDWNNASVVASDDSAGTYQIQFNGSVPDVHPGSVLAIDRVTSVRYIFVTSANVRGSTMSISSVEAYLTDIFANTEFTLSTDNNTKSIGSVFYPVEAYLMDENGGYQVLHMDSGRKNETHFTHNLWNFEFNNDGYVIHSGMADSILMDRMNMNLDFDLEMYMNFGGRTEREMVGDALIRYFSRAMKVKAALVGRFNTEQQIRCKTWASCHVSSPSIKVKKNLFPQIPIRFIVSGVPIVLMLQSDLCCKAEISASGEIQAYTGFSNHAEGWMGFEWNQTGGITPVTSFENTFSFTPPTVEGRGEIQGKLWAFPSVSVMLYGIVGPSFDLMPYLNNVLRGGYREQMLGQGHDYCAWTFDSHVGADFSCGLNLNFFRHNIYNDAASYLSTNPLNLKDELIYHSPIKVVHTSGRPQGGQSTTVNFNVYDQWYLPYSEFLTSLPQIVKFEASGQLSSEYGIAHEGTVSVNWTPVGSDTLWAKLCDIEGNVISWDTVIVENVCDCNLTSGDWVDLGLPSGLLWATRNVGASSPTGFGNYYAWGETSPKSVYNLSTYQHYQCDNNKGCGFTKYCTIASYGYHGFVDNLTTLQPSDDAATANYGGRLPTLAEWQELMNNTISRWITFNGVSGRCFTGSNGNSLFLPAAGFYYGDHRAGVYGSGHYWSASLDPYYPDDAWRFYFESCGIRDDPGSLFRDAGFSVRAVRSAK